MGQTLLSKNTFLSGVGLLSHLEDPFNLKGHSRADQGDTNEKLLPAALFRSIYHTRGRGDSPVKDLNNSKDLLNRD